MEKINKSSLEEIEQEIDFLTKQSHTPFVEKNLRLGYLYFTKDCLGAATNMFQEIVSTVSKEKGNPAFVSENREGLNILYMGWRIVEDGCGGFRIVDDGCDSCGPFCCCCGIIAVMGICGINCSEITTCNTADGQGCLDNCMDGCCGGCAACCGCRGFT